MKLAIQFCDAAVDDQETILKNLNDTKEEVNSRKLEDLLVSASDSVAIRYPKDPGTRLYSLAQRSYTIVPGSEAYSVRYPNLWMYRLFPK